MNKKRRKRGKEEILEENACMPVYVCANACARGRVYAKCVPVRVHGRRASERERKRGGGRSSDKRWL